MATYKAIIRKGEQFLREDKTSNIKIRITHNRKQVYVATNYYVLANNWDNAQGLCKGFENAKFINEKLRAVIAEYSKKDIQFGEAIDRFTATDLRDNLTEDNRVMIDFIAFSEVVVTKLLAQGKTNTAIWHSSGLLPNLKKFISTKTLDINLINSDFLNRFEKYLYDKENANTAGGVNNYMRSFRSLFNQCRDKYNDEDTGKIVIKHYPFKKYQIPTVKRRQQGKSLTIAEMKLIINYVPTSKRKEWTKDTFILLFCLIGINVKDIYFMRKPKLGRLEFDRFKTGREYSIKLEPEALNLIDKYSGMQYLTNMAEKYVLQKSVIKYMNVELKAIALALGIEKPISTNYARHTWGTIARNNGISKDDVSLCLGHETGSKITDDYIDYDYSIQDKANRKVLDLVFTEPVVILAD